MNISRFFPGFAVPFIALCPHCRSAKVQAPTRKRGQMHRCPKCNLEFPLVPQEESAVPVEYKLPPEEYDIDAAYREPPRNDFATARTEVQRPMEAPTGATPSEVVPIPPAPPPVPVTPSLDYTPSVNRPEPPLMMALASGGVFGLAMVATQFTYGLFVAIPLLLVGLALGFLALPGLHERKSIGWGAIIVNAIGLFLVLLLPSWLGVSSWLPEGDPNAVAKPAISVPRDGSAPTPADWVDAQRALWQQDDVRVDVLAVKLEPLHPKVKPTPGQPMRRVLRITMKISNVGVARSVQLNAWPPDMLPKLSVASGPVVPFTKVESALPTAVLPGKDYEMVLQFEVPPAVTDSLKLELAGVGFSVPDAVKLSIPAAMIGK